MTICVVCDAEDHTPAILSKLADHAIACCPACGFRFLARPPQSGAKVAINEHRYGGKRPNQKSPSALREDKRVLIELLRNATGRDLLDVGCGDGGFLSIAASEGWNVHGVELSVGAARTAGTILGDGRVHHGTLATAQFEPESFDVVVLKSVIEHVPDLRSVLRAIHRLLRPGGCLYVLTPNIESLDARIYGKRWFALVPGDHLWFFSPKTLVRLLSREGFALEWMTTTESYEDIAVAAVFALRSVLREWRAEAKGVASTYPESKMGFGLSPDTKARTQTLLEITRYLNLPWFHAYAYLIRRMDLGACIRGVFIKRTAAG